MSDPYETDVPMDAQDRAVLDHLARVVAQVDPVPDGLVETTMFAIALDGLDAVTMAVEELAAAEPVGVRSEALDRETIRASTMTFVCDAVTVMITVSASPTGGLCIDGWAAPAQPYVVELYRPDGRVRTETEDDGGFVLLDVPEGRMCLALRRADGEGPTVCTPVIEL